jgi:hypothetical protein
MLFELAIVAGLIGGHPPQGAAHRGHVAMAAHTYEARIRLDGRVSTTRVQASDAGQAKKLVQAQFGPKVTVLSVKRVD